MRPVADGCEASPPPSSQLPHLTISKMNEVSKNFGRFNVPMLMSKKVDSTSLSVFPWDGARYPHYPYFNAMSVAGFVDPMKERSPKQGEVCPAGFLVGRQQGDQNDGSDDDNNDGNNVPFDLSRNQHAHPHMSPAARVRDGDDDDDDVQPLDLSIGSGASTGSPDVAPRPASVAQVSPTSTTPNVVDENHNDKRPPSSSSDVADSSSAAGAGNHFLLATKEQMDKLKTSSSSPPMTNLDDLKKPAVVPFRHPLMLDMPSPTSVDAYRRLPVPGATPGYPYYPTSLAMSLAPPVTALDAFRFVLGFF